MGRVVVDGVEIEVPDGQTISIQSSHGTIRINNSVVGSVGAFNGRSEVKLVVEGAVANIDAAGSVECGDVSGDIDAGGSVNCRNVEGSVDAGGSVNCGNVKGDVDAGGSVTCASRRR